MNADSNTEGNEEIRLDAEELEEVIAPANIIGPQERR